MTAALFTKGFLVLAIISGLVLSAMTATALALFGLAWSLTAFPETDDAAELLTQPG